MPQGSRLTTEQIAFVAEALALVPSWRAAADAAGINRRTLARYQERAENYDKRHETDDEDIAHLPHTDDPDWFCWDAVQTWHAARSRGEMQMVELWRAGAEKDWRAAQALLKAGFPDDYSDRMEVTGKGGGPIDVRALVAEAEERAEEALAEIRTKRAAAGLE